MSIPAGTRLGRYEIISLIGAGGMGEVYRAFDAELKRTVALKFLPAEVAADPKRLDRFEREALTASALNHPNILTVFDICQTDDGRRFFATEFIDGVTLREHMKARRLKLGEVLDVAAQVAGALVEAHGHGIIHRDIKPENVMVRRDGYLKVLDFGLAKLTGNPAGGVDTEAATRALVVTDAGAVMGTVSYMSPEQSRGEDVHSPTDVWSLGVVLYEMLTGHLPFRGKSASHTIVAIQDEEPPPLSAHVPDAPEALQEVISDVLSKDPEARLTAKQMLTKLQRLKRRLDGGGNLDHSVVPNISTASGEVSGRGTISQQGTTAGGAHATAAVTGAGETPATATGEHTRTGGRRKRLALVAALSAIVLASAGFGLYKFLGGRRSSSSPPVAPLQQMKFTRVPVGGEVGLSYISPDGRFIARVVREKSKDSLRLRQVEGTAEREIVPPADAYFLGVTFSPDGNNLYYVMGETGRSFRRLYRLSILGGDPQKLIDDVDSGITLSPDGRRLAFMRHLPKTRESTLVVANEDGTGEQVIATRQAPAAFGDPAWSPDGQLLAHATYSKDDEGEYVVIETTALSDRATKPVSPSRWRWINSLNWLPDGAGLVVAGKPRSAPEDDRGQIWYIPFPAGEAQKITNDANNYYGLTLTADARTALVLQSDFASNVWVAPAGDFARARQITNSNSEINEVCWTADGRIIYSGRTTGRQQDLWVINADGTGNRQLTFSNDLHEYAPNLSPDGRHVVFMTNRENLRTIWRMSVDGGAVKELVRNVDQRADPHVSPDSQWVYYNSRDETGNTAFWKVPFDGGQPVKVRERTACRLSPDGKWFVCSHRDLVPDAPMKLLVVPSAGGDPVRTFDPPKDALALPLYWSPDGQAFDFIAERDGIANVWRLPLAGGREQKLTDWPTAAPLYAFAWSLDGRTLALTRDMQKSDLVLIQNFR